MVFSPTGWAVAYRVDFYPLSRAGSEEAREVCKAKNWHGPDCIYPQTFAVLGNRISEAYLTARYLTFGRDGMRLAFLAQSKTTEGSIAVVGTREIKPSSPMFGVERLHLSANGENVAYVARKPRSNGLYVVSNSKVLGPYSSVRLIQFLSDGRLVFSALPWWSGNPRLKQGKGFIAIGESVVDWPADFQGHPAVISPDGSNLAYIRGKRAHQGGQQHVVFRGKSGKAYDSVSYLRVSRDGQRIAYVAVKYTGVRFKNSFLVLD